MQCSFVLAGILITGVTFEMTKALDPSNATYWTSTTESHNTPAEKSLTPPQARSKSSVSYETCTKSMVKEEQAAQGLFRNS